MHAKNASVVINPRTGQNIVKITDVLAVLSAAGWKTSIGIKEYGGHTMELANEAANNGRNLIIAYGGDGTLNQVVNGVMTSKGPHSIVGVIPGGTANVWAGEIGIPIDPVKAALSLVNSEARKVDIGHVAIEHIAFPSANEQEHAPTQADEPKSTKKKTKLSKGGSKAKHHFLLMAGLGIDAAIMGNVSKPLKYRIGPLAVGLSAAKELSTHRSFPIEIRTGTASYASEPLWKGEASQVVIGNTRRYGDIAEMTPDAYIDDGVLDVCVITAGDPLSTMQQISSLLLRRKPDNLSAEYFHGAHLSVTVPSSVPMQLDGSAVKLKDYLEKAEYETLQQATVSEHVMITYRFDALPRALDAAIPNAYNDELFEQSNSRDASQQDHADEDKDHKKSHVKAHHHKHDENPQTRPQQQTEAEVSRPSMQLDQQQEDDKKRENENRKELPGLISSLLTNGRKVTVVGKASNPEKKDTYIIAGGSVKQATGETKPVAVVVNGDTTILNREGARVAVDEVRNVQEGMVLVVEGKKSKRGVIEAIRMVL
ncbi:MAG: hypothetical protein NVS4B11_25080 [Ktedonobacteraceae bacterium]